MSRICLITPHHISFQPRALREADSLHEAGHDVRVICKQTDDELAKTDLRLVHKRGWRIQTVDLRRRGSTRWSWTKESVRSKVSAQLFRAGITAENVIGQSYVRGLSQLVELASSEPTDWFVAHTHAALPVAAIAARSRTANLGFDCEDLLADNGTDPPEVVRHIERRHLPFCEYTTVPSNNIAKSLAEDYGIPLPTVLYNVFPLSLASALEPPRNRLVPQRLRLHWFGQTIGPGRGIEEVVKASNYLHNRVELHLRGRITPAFKRTLEELPGNCELIFHQLIDHDRLVESLGCFDIGLATERSEKKNQSLTASNKLFSYLLAGLAIAATETPGQREVLEQTPNAGFLYKAGDHLALAHELNNWIENPNLLRAAQEASWFAARSRFCWDKEKTKWLSLFDVNKKSAQRLS